MQKFATIAKSADRAVHRYLGPALFCVVGLGLLVSCTSVAHETLRKLTQLRDVGYPDSATLLIVDHFLKTGTLYRDYHQPPYHLTMYGPLFYVLLSPAQALSSFLGLETALLVRSVVLGAWCLALSGVYSIAKKISRDSSAAWMTVLFAAAPLPLSNWTTQIRGDFVALAFCIWGVRLALSANSPARIAAAGICAGCALLVKLTFAAAPAAVTIWLIFERRYKQLSYWIASVSLTVAAGYGLAYYREPLLLDHIAALGYLPFEFGEAERLLHEAFQQAVTPFAIAGLVAYCIGRSPGHLGVLFYTATAWAVALATIAQVGGSINYFVEALFVSAIPAGIVVSQSRRELIEAPQVVAVLLLAMVSWSSLDTMRSSLSLAKPYFTPEFANRKATDDSWRELESALAGEKLLSTLPQVTRVGRDPEVPDPFLNASLEVGGAWSYDPIAAKIRQGVYDAIVIRATEADTAAPLSFRGIRRWSPAVWSSLRATYERRCTMEAHRVEVWLPPSPDNELEARLQAIGCSGSS